MSSKVPPSSPEPAEAGSNLLPGSAIIVNTIIEQGVDVIFGYPGGVVLPLFDKLYDAPLRVINPRHEQGGCHMADAYARASGKVGVIIVTSGPGACNLTTGLATAMMDSVPIVALTGQVRIKLPGYHVRTKGHARQIALAAEAINSSQRPVLYAGGGIIIANASEALRTMAKKAHLPVTTTLLGLGCFDQAEAQSLDMLGMHGTAYANYAVQQCDLLIAVGARFDDRITGKLKAFAPHAKIIHVDIDPASISKNVQVDIPVVGDAKLILGELVKQVEYRERAEWFKQINEWKSKYPIRYDNSGSTVKPQYVVEELCRQTRGQAIITTGVGQNQMWAAQFYRYSRPRQFISSGGLGTMGYGLPAAIGAQIARPDQTVVDIDGDSSFNMTLTELSTAVQYKLPVKVCLLNNGYMGMVRQWQQLFYNKRYSNSSLVNPDFAEVARAFGAVGITVEKKKDVPAGIKQMLAEKGPCVANFKIEREENVWPMVPAGKSLDEMDGLDVIERLV